MFGIWTIFGLSLVLSTWNAVQSGASWTEVKAVGGFRRVIVWLAAIASAYGFISVYGALAAAWLYHAKMLGDPQVQALTSHWLAWLGPPFVMAVVMLFMRSWAISFRNGGYIDYGDSVYDVWVPINNSRVVSKGTGAVIANSGSSLDFDGGNGGGLDLVSSGNGGGIDLDVGGEDGPKVIPLIVAFVVVTCVISLAGVTTWLIIRHVSRRVRASERLPRSYETARARLGSKA